MRLKQIVRRHATCVTLAAAALTPIVAPAGASGAVLHVVTPGQSLSSVAATDGLTVSQLAAANGISPTTRLLAGSTLAIPPKEGSITGAPTSGAPVAESEDRSGAPISETEDRSGDLNVPVQGSSTTSTGPVSGSYVVQRGDTLWGIASRAGMTVAELAAINGLNPRAYLLSGTVLRLGGGSTDAGASPEAGASPMADETPSVRPTTAGAPVTPLAESEATGTPYPTDGRVSASEIASIAAANGVPPSLADAIGWQESGFNNDAVSSAGAIGVMQILPSTWQWINSSLTPTPLSPSSAADNVRGGVLLLHSLLSATGGSPSMAAAGYYQGLPSVERYGLFPETERYVDDVLSLVSTFGGS